MRVYCQTKNINKMKNLTIELLESDGFFGMDESLEMSLFEYGLIAKRIGLSEYKFIYRIADGVFDYAFLKSSDIFEITNESWFDLSRFESFSGTKVSDLSIDSDYDVINLVFDIISYYGYENIFGSSYYGFEIKETKEA